MQSINNFQLARIHFDHHGMKFANDSPLNTIIYAKTSNQIIGNCIHPIRVRNRARGADRIHSNTFGTG
jgi:hypothetical protein